MVSGGCTADVEAGDIAIGIVVGIPVAVVGSAPVVTVPVVSWTIKDVGSHDCEPVMVAVATILVTSGLEEVDVGIDVGIEVIVGVGVTSVEAVDVTGKELVDTEVGELDVGSVVFCGTDIVDEIDDDVTGGGVDVGMSVKVVLEGISDDDDGGSVDDDTGGAVEVPFPMGVEMGVEDGGKVTGALAVSDGEAVISVLFPPDGVETGVEDVGANVDVGTDVTSELLNVGTEVGVDETPPEKDAVGVEDDSVALTVGSKLVISEINPVELRLGVGVASEVAVIEDVALSVSEEAVSLTDAEVVAFDVGDPGIKVPIALVIPSSKPPLEVDVGVEVVVTAVVGNKRIPEEDVSVGVGVESDVRVESDVGIEFDVGVASDVVASDVDVKSDTESDVDSLVVSAEAEDETGDVAFAMEEVNESELPLVREISEMETVDADDSVAVVSSLIVGD